MDAPERLDVVVQRHQPGRRVETGSGDRVGEEDAVPVTQLAGLLPRRGTGDQLRAQAGPTEARALLLDEDGDAEGPGRCEAALAQDVDRGQRGYSEGRSGMTAERGACAKTQLSPSR